MQGSDRGNTRQVLPQSTGREQSETASVGFLDHQSKASGTWGRSTSKLATSGPKP